MQLQHNITEAIHIWLPGLAHREGAVIGDHVLRTPAILFANDKMALALVLDVDDLQTIQNAGLRVWLDYDNTPRLLTVCVGGYKNGPEIGRHGNRHIMYRFHIFDPIRFQQDLKITMQAIGWRRENRYLPLQDDIASVAYWYQAEPHAVFPGLGSRDQLEII